MKQITLNIRENRFSFLMQLVQSLDFVQVAEEQSSSDSYDPDFVAKIQQSQQEFEDGNYIRVEKKGLREFLGL